MEGNTTILVRGSQKNGGEEKPSKWAELLDGAMVIHFVWNKMAQGYNIYGLMGSNLASLSRT